MADQCRSSCWKSLCFGHWWWDLWYP